MIYAIQPYATVGGFRFGCSQVQIAKAHGAPFTTVIDNSQKIVTETREGCELVYERKALCYVTLNRDVAPVVEGIAIYASDALAQLMALDPDHAIGPRYALFRRLGICVGGLGVKRIPEGRLVSAFAEDKRDFFEFFVAED
ncbi:hypothetical protein [Xanthomonas sp. CFBP 8445]|uniref:hypothetical protein n=1 Tax=Xanthomonas sp. CFBP 8445 TaxID=2971236 RepID=UPI0002E0CD14|nr:hypothetical protein [Xanthomonas sp. CFBP 8445]UYC13008.1 hypothetical protein NUG21_04460 [Xanthomonas sp. CFBP 8445]